MQVQGVLLGGPGAVAIEDKLKLRDEGAATLSLFKTANQKSKDEK